MAKAKAIASEAGKFGLIFLIVAMVETGTPMVIPDAGELSISVEVGKMAVVLSIYYLANFVLSWVSGAQ